VRETNATAGDQGPPDLGSREAGGVSEHRIEPGQVNVQAPPGPARSEGGNAGAAEAPELDRRDLGDQAAAEAGGFEEAPPAERRLTGAELVKLLEVGKLGLVKTIGKRAGLAPEVTDPLAKIAPDTRALLETFGDDAASFLPALNASAPVIGACVFALVAGFDLWSTTSELKRLVLEKRQAEAPRQAPTRDAHGGIADERPAWVKGREDASA